MNKIIVAITTIIDPVRTIKLLDSYLNDPDIDKVWIFDNGHKQEDANLLVRECSKRDRSIYVDTRGLTLAQQWNKAILDAEKINSYLIISNDDIEIFGNVGKQLAEVLQSSEDIAITYPGSNISGSEPVETKGTFGDGGMRGDCFMIKPHIFKDMLVDERFTYWGLDDDLARSAENSGYKQFRVYRCAMSSDMQGTSLTEGFEWMLESRSDDIKLLKEKWNIGR
jgi:GT2 family glycosyltransferase